MEKIAEKYYGNRIMSSSFKKEDDGDIIGIILEFSRGLKIEIIDKVQLCCEHRYITCDDNVYDLVGHILKHILVKEGPTKIGAWDNENEIRFVEIATDKNFITLVTHNDHNGYYSGFNLTYKEI